MKTLLTIRFSSERFDARARQNKRRQGLVKIELAIKENLKKVAANSKLYIPDVNSHQPQKKQRKLRKTATEKSTTVSK